MAHGDLQPGNLLFSVKSMVSLDESCLSQWKINPASLKPITRRDGKVDFWAPKYRALNQPLTELVDLGPDFVIKISDMGGDLSIQSSLNELLLIIYSILHQ